MIRQIHRYEDEEGKTVIERVPLTGHEAPSERLGIAGIQTPRGTMQIEFPIPADISLEDAFARYEEFASAQLDRMRAEAPRVQVAPPGILEQP